MKLNNPALQLVPTDGPVTVWLNSGEILTGTGYTYDVNGTAQIFQGSGPPIVVDMSQVAAIQATPPETPLVVE